MKNDQSSPGTPPGEFLTYRDGRSVPGACLVSEEAPECESILKKIFGDGFRVFRIPEDTDIPYPVRCHPDMIFTVIGGSVAAPASYYRKHAALLCDIAGHTGKSLVLTEDERGARYPSDTGLNAAVGRDFVIARKKSCSESVLALARKEGLRLIDVNQGYAGCSCIVTDSVVITSDRGIHSSLVSAGIRSEYVSNEGIRLPGYDRGFIGGAGGYACGRVFLFGSPSSFPGGGRLSEICGRENISITEIPCFPSVTDYGGLKFIF